MRVGRGGQRRYFRVGGEKVIYVKKVYKTPENCPGREIEGRWGRERKLAGNGTRTISVVIVMTS